MAELVLRLPSIEREDPWIVQQKLFGILNEYLQPSSSTSPLTAATEIDNLSPDKRQGSQKPKESRKDEGNNDNDDDDDEEEEEEEEEEEGEDIESFLLEAWDTFIELARQIPSDHGSQDRLVDLLKVLTELRPTKVQIWGEDTLVWTDLPLLAPAMREAWISPTYNDKMPAPEASQRWINQNAFAARLLNLDSLTWSHFAVWSLRSALEDRPSKKAETRDCDIIAAAQWIFYCGPYLYNEAQGDAARELLEKEKEEDPKEKALRGEPLAPGSLYKRAGGKPRFSVERWDFWQQRFVEIGGQTDAEEVKAAAEKATTLMSSIQA
ncbi:hypothetical protein FQN57_003348 [Myotisia sp. PD_48]|nr:hypothetical protein FQN57_003348 [Myotisia sp. PD_48]